MRTRNHVVVVSSLLALAAAANADYVPGATLSSFSLSGNTQYDGWIGLTATNYPGYGSFPGGSPWPGPIGSNRTTANTFNLNEPGDAGIIKVANGAGGGPLLVNTLYFGGFSATPNTFGGTVAFTDSTPVTNLRNVVFQVQIGEALGVDFFNHALPTLSYNGGTQNLPANISIITNQYDNGTFDSPVGPQTIYINTYLLQWDLSAIPGITSFQVGFSGAQHAQVYGARLDQSDVFTPVPAPAPMLLMGMAGLSMVQRKR
ncbi:MAG TPA: hypothetical protein VG797_03175 [Phycisphaerales bacterium]|nr:hypothetical protein [Phycisphaerales bacterium]